MSDNANLLDIDSSYKLGRFELKNIAISAAMDYGFLMETVRKIQSPPFDTLPFMPPWITSMGGKTSEDVSFLSGAALSHLHLMLDHDNVPCGLLRQRLALDAAEACVAFSGRVERSAELRDTVHLRRPGDLAGPAGETYLTWRDAVEQPASLSSLHHALNGVAVGQIASWLDAAGAGGPVVRAAMVFEAVLIDAPRAEVPALILADAVLSQVLGWRHVVPLLAAGLKRSDLRKRGDDLRDACHRAAITSAIEAARMAADLARRAARLQAVAPKLRAKGAGAAIEIFLTQDAVTPMSLPLPDRAARRLCDRLVALGVLREMTGRDTFRLYGV